MNPSPTTDVMQTNGATFVFLIIGPNDLFDNKEAPYETPFNGMTSRQLDFFNEEILK